MPALTSMLTEELQAAKLSLIAKRTQDREKYSYYRECLDSCNNLGFLKSCKKKAVDTRGQKCGLTKKNLEKQIDFYNKAILRDNEDIAAIEKALLKNQDQQGVNTEIQEQEIRNLLQLSTVEYQLNQSDTVKNEADKKKRLEQLYAVLIALLVVVGVALTVRHFIKKKSKN